MTVVNKFLTEVGKFPRTSAFRGQADASWELHSAATRRLIEHYDVAILEDMVAFAQLYADYHSGELIEPAKTANFSFEEGYPISDLQILAKLQHFGAATGLLDFTWNPLVALWFACRAGEGDECDGKVFVINLNDPMNFQSVPNDAAAQSVQAIFPDEPVNTPWYWEPMPRNLPAPRILRQRSVFVIGQPLIPGHVVNAIKIEAADKKAIRQELEDQLDINEQSLFIDIHGFSTANSTESPIRRVDSPSAYFIQGNRSYQQSDYLQAIQSYDRCIQLAPDIRELYVFRGNAKAEIQNFSGAQQDYDSALARSKKLYLNRNIRVDINSQIILFNRGNVRAAQHEYREAIADYDKAVSLSRSPLHPSLEAIFFNRANAKVDLGRFEEAIEDYDNAISLGHTGALFNKGNALVLLGRFDEALQCYDDKSLRRGRHTFSADFNKTAVMGILRVIDGAKPEINTLMEPLAVEVKIAGGNQEPSFFPFQGRIGNTGNSGNPPSIGRHSIPGGAGFDGGDGFSVTVVGGKMTAPNSLANRLTETNEPSHQTKEPN